MKIGIFDRICGSVFNQGCTVSLRLFQLLRLASLLQMSGSDEMTRRGRVLSLVAQRALDHDDFIVAYSTCAELMKTGHIPGWKICR